MSADSLERYNDPEALQEAYDRHDGFLKDVYAEFDASDRQVRRSLIRHDVHEPNEDQAKNKYTKLLEESDPEDLGLSPIGDRQGGDA